jgi:superfamily II DNA or RNA helicase
MKLRPYQSECVDAVFREWEEHNSTLAVAPTGTGKTVIFSEIIKRVQPARCLVLAHRQELIYQAKRKIEAAGLECAIEMGEEMAIGSLWNGKPVILSTVQTQSSGAGGGRMKRFNPHDFSVVICDEAHHFCSPQFRSVVDYYRQNPKIKILGCTATPDRADEQALGQVFQSVAFDYEILDAIHDGWLVPIEQQMVTVSGLDFSHIRTTAGDLNGADLAAVMEAEEVLHGIASPSIEIIGDKKTLVFTASVKHAEMLADIFNRHKPGCADWVCGTTPKDKRRDLLRKFASGETQIVCNCGVLGEGYDEPGIGVVIQARPTKSRCLYSQQIGRGTRPLSGVVDALELASERKLAIAESGKPSVLVVDFVGNAGRHKLMTTADILGGKCSDEVIERAKHRAEQSGEKVRMDALLDEEVEEIQKRIEEQKQREAARKAHLVAKAKWRSRSVSPFELWDLTPALSRGWDKGRSYSEKQKNFLLDKLGIDPASIPYAQGNQLIQEQIRRYKEHKASYKQCALLKRYGYDVAEMSFEDASARITELKNNGWRKPGAERKPLPMEAA